MFLQLLNQKDSAEENFVNILKLLMKKEDTKPKPKKKKEIEVMENISNVLFNDFPNQHEKDFCSIKLRILSTWSNIHIVGLT
jgi:hypothetical protein